MSKTLINIIGIGPGDYKYLTLEAEKLIKNSTKIFSRTKEHATIKYLKNSGVEIKCFDNYYEESKTFDEVYEKIVAELIFESRSGNITYLVPGSPVVFEKTVTMLIERKSSDEIRIVHGVSFLDILFTKVQLDPLSGFSVVDALSLKDESFERRGAIVVTQCYDRFLASEVKLWLGNIIDDESEIILCHSVGNSAKEKITKIFLYELDHRDDFTHETSVIAII